MQKEEIIFELKTEVVENIIEKSYTEFESKLDLEHLAFNNFKLRLKANDLFSMDGAISLLNKNGFKKADLIREEMLKCILDIDVTIKDRIVNVYTYLSNLPNQPLLVCSIPKGLLPVPIVKKSILDDQTTFRALQVYKLVLGTLYQLDGTNYEPVVSSKFLDAPKGNKKKGKKNNKNKYVKYLVTKKYIIDSIKTEPKEREYTKPSWAVKGYWRKYKSGKKVWIEPSTRKRKSLTISEEHEPTIVKINHTIN